MGRKKLLKKLTEFFDMDTREREKRKDELNKLLSRLKKKEHELKEELEDEKDEQQKNVIAQNIDVVHTQRKKGVQMLKDIRDETNGSE